MNRKKESDYAKAAELVADTLAMDQVEFRKIARVFGEPGQYAHLVSVFTGNNWTLKDVKAWRKTLARYEQHRRIVESTRGRDQSKVLTKKKPKKKL